jgi:hypothetical protein
MLFRVSVKNLALFVTAHVCFLPSRAYAELDCFKLLREKTQIARDFEDQFLPKIKGLDMPQEVQVDRRILREVVESVEKAGYFRVTSQVRKSSYYFNSDGLGDIAAQAVRVSYSRNQYFNFDRETFVRFFPENINLAQILGALRRAVVSEKFVPREVVYSRRDGASPEMMADAHLLINGQVVSVRFAIVIPHNDPSQPLVTLLTPLVTDKTHGKMTTVFLNPHNWEDHLVVSRWEHGTPVEGALVKGSQVLDVTKASVPFEQIAEGFKNTELLENFDERIDRIRTFYDRLFEKDSEAWFKDEIVRRLAESGEFDLFNSLRNQLAPFPYFGYKKQNTLEHAAVQRGRCPFLNLNLEMIIG